MIIKDTNFQLVAPRDPNRSYDKVHQSTLVRDIALKMGYLSAEFAEEEISDWTKVCVGLAWEDWLCKNQHPDICYHPGEYEVDGIVVTPDGISFGDFWIEKLVKVERPVVHEFKFSWKSCGRSFEEDFFTHNKWWMWRTQVAAGCYVLETRFAQLHVLWANGNYGWMKRTADPVNTSYRVYDIEFNQYEVKQAWQMLLKHKSELYPSSAPKGSASAASSSLDRTVTKPSKTGRTKR